MQITSIETFPTRIPIKPERRMISALGRHDVSDYLLVRVETNEGVCGVGEATVTPCWSGETVWGAHALIRDFLAPALVGADPLDVIELNLRMDAVAVDNWFAKSAIEMAAWDIAGIFQQRPVYELLGGACRPLVIRSRFSLGAYSPELSAERAVERVRAGFDTIKIKVGTDPEQDIARVQAVRQAVGKDIHLTIDANGGWNFDQALKSLEQLESCKIELVEQPLPRRNFSELKLLRERTGCRILADESCFDEIEARELILQGCCDALTLYPGKNGGILKAQRIAQLAAQYEIPCTIGSNLEWDVATAAMLHLVIATPNINVEQIPGDCLGPFYHESSIVHQPLKIDGPLTTMNNVPGLGVSVDWDRVSRYTLYKP
jgi:L-alanine-DL-glutamate epimerase-like enolase superfamily enzyme